MEIQKRLDKIDIDIPLIGGNIDRFYSKVKEINNSIDFSKIDVCSKSKFIKSRLDLSLLNTYLLFATVSFLPIVIIGSINFLSSFAFGRVVLMISLSIKAIARFLNKAFL